RRADRHDRSQTAQGEKPGLADEQRRMDDEPTRDGGSESLPARLRRLPYARAHRALDPRCRRMDPGHRAHEWLWAGEPADQAAAHARSSAFWQPRAIPQTG